MKHFKYKEYSVKPDNLVYPVTFFLYRKKERNTFYLTFQFGFTFSGKKLVYECSIIVY